MVDKHYHRAYYKKHAKKILARKNSRNKKERSNSYEKLREYCKNNPCVKCGEDDFVVLEFDHINPDDKVENISDMVKRGFAFSKIEAELKKCQVLCCNCHRRKTAEQLGWYK